MKRLAHQTLGAQRLAVAEDLYWEFHPGDRVLADGLPGKVTEVTASGHPGNEGYMVELDNGMGGGEYGARDLSSLDEGVTAALATEAVSSDLGPVEATTAMTADHFYPELGSILAERLPIEQIQRTASKRYPNGHVNGTEITDHRYEGESGIIKCQNCGKYHSATYDHDGRFGEGKIHAVVCPEDHLTDYYTDGVLEQRPTYPARGSVKELHLGAFDPIANENVQEPPSVCSFCGNPGPWEDEQDTGRGTRIRCGTCNGTMRLNADENTSGIQWQPEFPNSPQNAASRQGDPRATIHNYRVEGVYDRDQFARNVMNRILNPHASAEAGYTIFDAPELNEIAWRQIQATAASMNGVADEDFTFHFTAAWADVQRKAKRIRDEGGVRIVAASSMAVVGEVQGDSAIYESEINYVPGSHRVGAWHCGCKWGAYAWGRSPAYRRFEGRQCSHVLALQYEASSRGMFGREVTPDRDRLDSQYQRTPVVTEHQRPTERHPGGDRTRRTVPPGNMRREWGPKSRVRVKGSLHEAAEHDGHQVRQYAVSDPGPFISGHAHICDACQFDREGIPRGMGAQPSRHETPPGTKCENPNHERNVREHRDEPYSEYEQYSHDPEAVGWAKDDFSGRGKDQTFCRDCAANRHAAGDKDHPDWYAITKSQATPHDQCTDCGKSLIHDALRTEGRLVPFYDDVAPSHEWARFLMALGNPPSHVLDALKALGAPHRAARAAIDWASKGPASSELEIDGVVHQAFAVEASRVVTVEGLEFDPKRASLHVAKPEQTATADPSGGSADPGTDIPRLDKRDQTERKHKDKKHLHHHTNDARMNAPQFGYGLPWGGQYAWCDQCNGSGCGHCGGTGQVATGQGLPSNPSDLSSTESPVPDQSVDAGDMIGADGGGMNATGALAAFDQESCPHNQGFNLHGQCKRCGYLPPTEEDEPCDNPWCVKNEPEHSKGEHIDPPHLDPYHPDHQSAERGVEDAIGHHPDAWLFDHQQTGPSKYSSRRTADYTVNDFGSGNPAQTYQKITPHEFSPNPGSTGWGTSADPTGWVHPITNYSTSFSSWASKKDPGGPGDPPSVAGVALKAADTGRVLMIQRSNKDEKDPARGTWEFPGGHKEEGDQTSLHTGIREWEEEVGHPFPEGGHVSHVHRNGPYMLHTVVIPEESAVDFSNGRRTVNPDDPDHDDHEQSAWWDPEHARKNPALRQECKSSPWNAIQKAASEKRTDLDEGGEYGGLPERPHWVKPNGIDHCRTCGTPHGDISSTTGQCAGCDNRSNSTVHDPLQRAPEGGSTHAWWVQHGMDPDHPMTGQHEPVSLKGWHPEDRMMHTLSSVTSDTSVGGNGPDPTYKPTRHTTAARHDICQNCGQGIHDANGIDPNVPWVHEQTGNSFCDVEGTSDAALLAGSPLHRPEAGPVMHQARFLTVDEVRAVAQAEMDRTGKTAEQLLREHVAWQESHFATLHDEPEPALPSTDGAQDDPQDVDDDAMAAAGFAPDESTEAVPGLPTGRVAPWGYPESAAEHPDPAVAQPPGPVGSGAVETTADAEDEQPGSLFRTEGGLVTAPDYVPEDVALAAAFNPALAGFAQTAGFKALAADAGAGPDQGGGVAEGGPPNDSDIAKAAQALLQKTAGKDFSFAEQQELISEGGGVARARNFGDLHIAGTHYEALGENEAELDAFLLL